MKRNDLTHHHRFPELKISKELVKMSLSLNILNFFFNVYLFLRGRETECKQGRGRERGGDTGSKAGSRLRAVSTEPDVGLKLMNCETIT